MQINWITILRFMVPIWAGNHSNHFLLTCADRFHPCAWYRFRNSPDSCLPHRCRQWTQSISRLAKNFLPERYLPARSGVNCFHPGSSYRLAVAVRVGELLTIVWVKRAARTSPPIQANATSAIRPARANFFRSAAGVLYGFFVSSFLRLIISLTPSWCLSPFASSSRP